VSGNNFPHLISAKQSDGLDQPHQSLLGHALDGNAEPFRCTLFASISRLVSRCSRRLRRHACGAKIHRGLLRERLEFHMLLARPRQQCLQRPVCSWAASECAQPQEGSSATYRQRVVHRTSIPRAGKTHCPVVPRSKRSSGRNRSSIRRSRQAPSSCCRNSFAWKAHVSRCFLQREDGADERSSRRSEPLVEDSQTCEASVTVLTDEIMRFSGGRAAS
jgi:hypothetical protein